MSYLIYLFADEWRAAGHRVLIHRGPENPPSADIAVLHVDQTVVPPEYIPLVSLYSRVINGSVLNIGKSRFSQGLVSRDGDWDGPVIVKTDANAGGTPERKLQCRSRSAALIESLRLQFARNGVFTSPSGPILRNYLLYASPREVPGEVWSTPGLLVEKFIPEQDERGYYLRVWTFFGDRERCTRYRAAVPLIKLRNATEHAPVPVPDQLRTWRDRLGFDYGKFDYVCPDGRPILLDTNKTPSVPVKPAANPQLHASFRSLACGLQAFNN